MSEFSIVIPALNEAPRIKTLLPYLFANASSDNPPEIIVCDGGSTDGTPEVAKKGGAKVITSKRGRACQMNAGARLAVGKILYFLHADSLPPRNYQAIIMAAHRNRETAGCFRLRFEPSNNFLNFFAWCTRINIPICRGGDQSLFIPKKWFETLGGFDERYLIYEDNEFTGRLYRKYTFTVLPWEITTSSRRYEVVGLYRLQYHYAVIHLKRFLGAGPQSLHKYYLKHLVERPVKSLNTSGSSHV